MDEMEISHSDKDAQYIRQKLNEYNCNFVQPDHHERLCLIVKRKDDIIGGLAGGIYWNFTCDAVIWYLENWKIYPKGIQNTIYASSWSEFAKTACFPILLGKLEK